MDLHRKWNWSIKKAYSMQLPLKFARPLSVMVMEGIHDATRVKKRGYTPTTSMGRFTRELYAIVKFSNILVQKERRVLNLEDVPKIIRTKLYSSLK